MHFDFKLNRERTFYVGIVIKNNRMCLEANIQNEDVCRL